MATSSGIPVIGTRAAITAPIAIAGSMATAIEGQPPDITPKMVAAIASNIPITPSRLPRRAVV